nr:Chain C, Melanoma-associated antigen 4 peptide [Homo sapiens]
KVLEHVVRV